MSFFIINALVIPACPRVSDVFTLSALISLNVINGKSSCMDAEMYSIRQHFIAG